MPKSSKGQITSANQAAIESANLKSVWSRETLLTQRTLIYCAFLLEQLVRQPKKAPRRKSAWQQFLSVEMKAGSNIQQAAAKWRERGKIAA